MTKKILYDIIIDRDVRENVVYKRKESFMSTMHIIGINGLWGVTSWTTGLRLPPKSLWEARVLRRAANLREGAVIAVACGDIDTAEILRQEAVKTEGLLNAVA